MKLAAASSTSQRSWVEKVEDRLRMTSLALEKIKEVKMLGLSEKISSIIRGLRQAEVATSAVFRKLLIVRVVICELSQSNVCKQWTDHLLLQSQLPY